MSGQFWQAIREWPAIAPFAEFDFMRRALVACVALSLSGAIVGCLLLVRRLALMADAMAHALLPGAAAGYLLAGLSLWVMAAGGAVAAVTVAGLSGYIARRTRQREESSFAAIYISALAAGVLIVATSGIQLDLLHLLFGNVLAVDGEALLFTGIICTLVLLLAALSFRPLVLDSLESRRLAGSAWQSRAPIVYITLLVMHLVASLQVLGSLMAVGLLVIPAASARFWAGTLDGQMLCALIIGMAASVCGLWLSFYAATPAGPGIVLVAGSIYLLSFLAGGRGGLLRARLTA